MLVEPSRSYSRFGHRTLLWAFANAKCCKFDCLGGIFESLERGIFKQGPGLVEIWAPIPKLLLALPLIVTRVVSCVTVDVQEEPR